MKLQRYYQIEEKSWTRIGFDALLPLIAGKFIDKDIQTAEWGIAGLTLKPIISALLCIDMENIVIRTNNALLQKDNTFQHVDVNTSFTKDKTSLTQYFFELLKYCGTIPAICYSMYNPEHNLCLGFSLVSLSLDTIQKLFFPNTTEINYQYSLLSNYSNNYEFPSYIEWLGEADEDGYCECVVKDSYGNVYEDICIVN